MTLRDWFAGMAIQGIVGTFLFAPNGGDALKDAGIEARDFDSTISDMAYGIADALLERRKQVDQKA